MASLNHKYFQIQTKDALHTFWNLKFISINRKKMHRTVQAHDAGENGIGEKLNLDGTEAISRNFSYFFFSVTRYRKRKRE